MLNNQLHVQKHRNRVRTAITVFAYRLTRSSKIDITNQHVTFTISKDECTQSRGGGGGGGHSDIPYIRRLRSFFGFKILNFNIFWLFKKMNIFGV